MLLLSGCSAEAPSVQSVEISGREYKERPIYRARPPAGWIFHPQTPHSDTRRPLAEFVLHDAIRLTFHNFPLEDFEPVIPPSAQIARWKNQFIELDSHSYSIKPEAFSGFVGSFFSATGLFEGKRTCMMAWAMTLAAEHRTYLQAPRSKEEAARFKELRGSFTIKVVGPPEMMASEQKNIIALAHSFELIEELPHEL